MSKKQYVPRTLVFSTHNTKQLNNVAMSSISDKTIHMIKDSKHKIKLQTSIKNDNSGKIHVLPLSSYEESSNYLIVFEKTIQLESGQKLEKNVYLAFKVANGSIILAKADNHHFVSHLDDNFKLVNHNGFEYISKNIINPASETDDVLETSEDTENKRKRYLWFLLLLPILILIGINISKYISSAHIIKDALAIGSSTQIYAGEVISRKDLELESKDVYIKHRSRESTTILEIWDFAYEDGDIIQVFVDNKALTDEIVLFNEPIQIEVPTVGTVEVRGIFDGGGGITYAVYCELDETTYLNNAPIGGSNKYIFERRYF